MRLTTKIAYNTIIQITSKIISTILALVTVAIITRQLGQNGFGEYITVLTFLSFFAIAADLGLTLITVQMISKPNIDENRTLSNLFTLRLVSALLFLAPAPLVAIFFPYSHDIKIGVILASFSFLFIALNQVLVGIFQKNLRMDKVSIAEIISRLFLLISVIVAFKLKYGLLTILFITSLSSLLNFLFHFYFSQKFTAIRLQFDWPLWREIMTKSWPLALTITLNLIYLKTDTLLLSIIDRPSNIGILAEVGLYGAAYKVIDVLITLPFMFAGIILPIITLAWSQKQQEKFNNTLQKSFNVMAIIAVPLIFGTQLVAKDVMILVAGPDFVASGQILQILIIAAGMIFLGNMSAHAVIAIEKQKNIIKAYLFTAITSVIAYLLLIPHYSYFAAAWVTVYSETIVALASVYIVWKYTRTLPNLKIIIQTVLASLIMLVAMQTLHFLQITNLFVVITTAIVVYFFFLFIFKGLNQKEIIAIFKNNP
jgi:O-antigen/teichoic acid export membrane protein